MEASAQIPGQSYVAVALAGDNEFPVALNCHGVGAGEWGVCAGEWARESGYSLPVASECLVEPSKAGTAGERKPAIGASSDDQLAVALDRECASFVFSAEVSCHEAVPAK